MKTAVKTVFYTNKQPAFGNTKTGTFDTQKQNNSDYISDRIVDEFFKIQDEREKEFLRFIPKENHDCVRKFMELPGYYDLTLTPFFAEIKAGELENLYNLVSKKDKFGEYRVPAQLFPNYFQIPEQKLKQYEPILLSQNDLGTWNYNPQIIFELEKYSPKQIDLMTKLVQYKVHRDCIINIVNTPQLPWEKITEKAENLNKIYGNDLREISFFTNDQNETYLTAHIQLPHRDDKPDYYNFKQVFVKIGEDINPTNKIKPNAQTEKLVNEIYQNMEKNLSLFTEEELSDIIKKIKTSIPNAPEEDILMTLQKLTQFADYSSINIIGRKLKENSIGKIHEAGELSTVFKYFFTAKNLCPLHNEYKANSALLVTKKDISNPNFVQYLKLMSNNPDFVSTVRLVNLEGWADGVNLLSDNKKLEKSARKVLKKTYKAMHKNSSLTFAKALDYVLNHKIDDNLKELGLSCIKINVDNEASCPAIINQMRPLMPTKSIMKSNIELIAKRHTNGNKTFKKLCDKIAKYYAETNNIYTKQNIIESLEQFHSKLNRYLEKNNIPEKNVYFIKPNLPYCSIKSFDVITKMYQDMYNIENNKIIKVKSIANLNKIQGNSAFVILDDYSGTGESMGNVGMYDLEANIIDKDKHIVFAPIECTDKAKKYIKSLMKQFQRDGLDVIISSGKKQSNDNKADKDYLKIPKRLLGYKGYGENSACTVFPYMAVDNNSELAGDLTVFFLPNYTGIKNRSINLHSMKEDTYYYDIFGTDKDNVMTDSFRAYAPTEGNIIFDKIKSLIKKFLFNY